MPPYTGQTFGPDCLRYIRMDIVVDLDGRVHDRVVVVVLVPRLVHVDVRVRVLGHDRAADRDPLGPVMIDRSLDQRHVLLCGG